MDVNFWIYFIAVQIYIAVYCNEQHSGKRGHLSADDKASKENSDNKLEDPHKNKPLEFLTKLKSRTDHKDYFLPPFNNNDEENEDDVDDDNDETDEGPYLDYDYDAKETNYKDSAAEVSTSKANLDNSDLITFGELHFHTGKDNLPIFLDEPENTYVVKNKPASLKCRAANTLEVYFKCNGAKTQTANFEFVDPHSGVRIVEGEYNVTKEAVEEYFGNDKYQCSCVAWNSRGNIKSQPVTIELAFIKKQFTVSPKSQLVKQFNQATFRCEPPPAAPFAQVYWLKNGAPIVTDNNVQITKESYLSIKQASLLDMANYTCVAENFAGKRLSEPALLTVFVNGGWSSWTSWNDCSCVGSLSNGRRRSRTCTAPRPLNGGQPCVGPAVQKTQDCVDCEIDMYVDELGILSDDSSDMLLGRWSQWSEWSHCDSDCLQTRRRKCLTSSVCRGKDYQIAQCPLCVRTSKSDIVPEATSHWPLLLALSVTFLIFIVVVVLGIKYLKIKMDDNSPYVKPNTGSNYFGNVIKRTLTNQPDLTIHEEFHTLNSHHTPRHTMSTSTQGNEHLYEVPQLANSYITPIDQEVRTNMFELNERNYACKDHNESDHSDSSCFLSSGSSYGNESVEMSPSLKNNVSIDSKSLMRSNYDFDTTTSKIITNDGGTLILETSGVQLFIPEGAIDKNDRELFLLEVIDEEWSRPILQEGETQLTPVIRCGTKNVHFLKAIILSFPHCASINNSSWIMSILQKPEDVNSRHWTKILTLGQETHGVPIFAQVDKDKAYIVCEFLNDFVLVGKSFTGFDTKILKAGMFISKKLDVQDSSFYNVRVRIFDDTPYAFNDCVENEKRLGGTLLCDPKTVYFQNSCSDLCFNIRDIGTGWKLKSGVKYYEIPFSSIWSSNLRYLHYSFVLQQIDTINSLELNLLIYQKQKQSNCVNFSINTNDLNSNYNLTYSKRFSSSSMDKNYTLNIVENPFIYSSLNRKDGGRYDVVYKGTNFRRSNFNVMDITYGLNLLSKSDRAILCKLLDVQNPKGNDWRLLGEKLNLVGHYYFFSNTHSPTENILNLWICRSNESNMLPNLARIFREMNRIDCACLVERRC